MNEHTPDQEQRPNDRLSDEFLEALRKNDPRLIWTDLRGNRIDPFLFLGNVED